MVDENAAGVAARSGAKTRAPEASLPPELVDADLYVEQVAQERVLHCTPETPVYEAARQMAEKRCSSILVEQDGIPVGIWTERDALAIDFGNAAALERPIREVMSQPVRTIAVGTGLKEVAHRFRQEGIRHYLVVDEAGRRCGVVSQSDLVANHGIEHYLHLRKVKDAVGRPLLVLGAEQTLTEAAAHMREVGTDAVVVRYPDETLGILTERDVVRLIGERYPGQDLGAVASRPLRTVAGDATLYRVRLVLLESKQRHIGVTDEAGHLNGLVSFADIISGMELAYVRELQAALAERDRCLNISQQHLRLAEKVIETSLEGVMITDARGYIESVNPAFTRLTGFEPEDVIGQTPAILSSGRHDAEFYRRFWEALERDGHWQGEMWNRRKGGQVYPELLTVAAITDDGGAVTHYAALFSDITEFKENEERIRNLANYDPLTHLPNRRLMMDRLSVAIAHAHRHHGRVAVMFIDLDRFKRINDSLGHSVGDELLAEVSRRLSECVREDDTVARMGGDEFICVLSDIQEPEDAVHIARRVQELLNQPILADGEELVVSSSIGISVYPEDGEDGGTLVRNADTAMYRAKEAGRDGYQLYTAAMNARSLEHLALETAMRHGIERDEFTVYYQPIVTADHGALVSAEALLRWRHPEMGLVPPADFIPLAEETGLILPIGEQVLGKVCRQIGQWREAGHGDVHVAVNLSALQFRQEGFLASVQAVLDETGVPPGALSFELTERLLMDDAMETVHLLQRIHEMGIEIAVDDFGVGYSSLNYLKRFPISRLKIDRSFIRGVAADPEDGAIVSAVIELGHSLGQKVVAEGVEQLDQQAMLQANGCDLLQGFYFGYPVPAEQFAAQHL